jgi:hypothetical protein
MGKPSGQNKANPYPFLKTNPAEAGNHLVKPKYWLTFALMFEK